MSTDDRLELPWGSDPAAPAPVRRKVAWGSGAGFTESVPPRPRTDAAPQASPEGPSPWPGDTGSPILDAPSLEADEPDEQAPAAPTHPVWPPLDAAREPAREPGDETPAWPHSPALAAPAADASVDLASVFDDMFDEAPALEPAPEAAAFGPTQAETTPVGGSVESALPAVDTQGTQDEADADASQDHRALEQPAAAETAVLANLFDDDAPDTLVLDAGSDDIPVDIPVDVPGDAQAAPEVSGSDAPAELAGPTGHGTASDTKPDIEPEPALEPVTEVPAEAVGFTWADPAPQGAVAEPDLEVDTVDESEVTAPVARHRVRPDTAPVTAPNASSDEQAPTGSMPNAPAPVVAGRLDLASRRAALEAARQVTREDFARAQVDPDSLRYTQAGHFYNMVDRILGLGRGGDPELQAMIRRLELTRDKNLDASQRRAYQAMLEPRLAAQHIQLTNRAERDAIFDMAYDELIGIGPLGPLWRDDSVTEIMISGPYKVTVERQGRLELTPVQFRDQGHLEQTARTLAGISGDDRAVSATSPLVTVQLPRARVQFVWRPLAVSKVAIAIRKFGDLMDMEQLLTFGSLSPEMASFLCDAVTARATILVSGGTGSGKTTFINALSEFIPDTERVITIEDALELQLRNTHVESLVTKEAASADDTMLFGQDQLLKASLRMRPDRIIVGEIRDGKGASVMLEASNTGHDGTMTTIHANSCELALTRLSTLLRRVETMPDDVAKAEVGTAINVIVQVVRKRGRRFVSSISLVDPRAALTGTGQLVTPLFTGEFPATADAPVFGRAGGLRPDTDLAIKMTDAGIDPAIWE